jgi:hypothetical protein
MISVVSAAVPDSVVVGRPAPTLNGSPMADLIIPSDRGPGCQANLEVAEVGGCVTASATRQSRA